MVMLGGACYIPLNRAQVTFLGGSLRLFKGHISRGWWEPCAERDVGTETGGH